MAEYEWAASNSAPVGCPMKLVVGGFLLTGGGTQYIPSAILHEGWGQSVSAHNVGDRLKAIPEQLTVSFYSYHEDKFYSGRFDLPRERIAALFAAGYRTRRARPGEELTYNTIVAGVAPGGAVAAWLEGIGRTTEVYFGHAREVELNWHEAMRMPESENRAAYREEMLAYEAKSDPLVFERERQLDFGMWASYRTRYDLKFSFDGAVAENMEVKFFNGEQQDIFFPQDEASLAEHRAAPRFINATLGELSKEVDYVFDEAETLEVFQRLGGQGQPVEMIFKRVIDGNDVLYGVFLRNARETVELSKLKIKVYKL